MLQGAHAETAGDILAELARMGETRTWEPGATVVAGNPEYDQIFIKDGDACWLVDHERIRLDPEARNARHTHVSVSEDKSTWKVQQVLIDPEDHNDWMAEFQVDLAASRAAGAPVLRLSRLGPITA
jgi:hypothetical protein